MRTKNIEQRIRELMEKGRTELLRRVMTFRCSDDETEFRDWTNDEIAKYLAEAGE